MLPTNLTDLYFNSSINMYNLLGKDPITPENLSVNRQLTYLRSLSYDICVASFLLDAAEHNLITLVEAQRAPLTAAVEFGKNTYKALIDLLITSISKDAIEAYISQSTTSSTNLQN